MRGELLLLTLRLSLQLQRSSTALGRLSRAIMTLRLTFVAEVFSARRLQHQLPLPQQLRLHYAADSCGLLGH